MPDPAENNQEKEIFSRALDFASDQARLDFVRRVCGEDHALLARVLALLLAHQGGTDFLPEKPRGASTVRMDTSQWEKPGDRLGRYKLLQQIGEGGCGVVYMAEQEQPVKRRVALKVIKLGMDTKEVIARFEAERQALALMDHPNIAKVLDAGATDSGRPFFVMELVRGIKITDYCDQNSLPMSARLELFTQVCRAVQHAHQKGIIHRDIKPSNILVTLNDGVPLPKVIDFGIAKATQGKLTDNTVFTAFEQFIGTPAYMSPEQAEMSAMDIDTRSDIYSLGVLLYELLTGQTPFDARELLQAGLDEMRRQIREQEPARPSTRLSSLLNADLTTIAAQRHAAGPKLVHLVRGDLDWIVMKCLEKDRTRRYDTANGLALDIERHLRSEPVSAVAPSAGYRLRKFVRRHRAGVLAAGILLLTLIAGIAGTTWGLIAALRQKREAQRQTAIARHTTDFLTGMFQSIDPAVAKQRDITVREILDEAGRMIATNFPNQPLVEMPIQRTMSEIYGKLGRQDLGLPHAQAAVKLAQAGHGGKDHPDVAESMAAVADALDDLGREEEAVATYNSVLAMLQRLDKGDNADVASALDNRALCLNALGRSADALADFQAALAMRQRLHKGDDFDVATSLNNVALGLNDVGRSADALPMYQAALAMDQRLYNGDHPAVAQNLDNVASCLNQLGRSAEALPVCEAALAMRQRIYKGDHPEVAKGLGNVAFCLGLLNRSSEALVKYQESLAMLQRIYPGDHPQVARTFNNIADRLVSLGRPDEALTQFQAALAMNQRLSQGDNPEVAFNLNNIATCLSVMGRPEEAQRQLEAALAMRQRLYPGDHPNVAWSLNSLAVCLYAQGLSLEALPRFEAASQMFQRLFPGDHPYKARNLHDTGNCLNSLLRRTEALAKLEAGLAMRQRIYHGDNPDVADSLCTVAGALKDLNRPDDATVKYKETMDMLARLSLSMPDNIAVKITLAKSLRGQGDLLARKGDVPGATQDYQRALQTLELVPTARFGNSPVGKLRLNLRAKLGLEEVEVVVLEALPGSPAQAIGLQKGDVLLRYASQRITTKDQLAHLTANQKGAAIELEMRRDGQPMKFVVSQGDLGITSDERPASVQSR